MPYLEDSVASVVNWPSEECQRFTARCQNDPEGRGREFVNRSPKLFTQRAEESRFAGGRAVSVKWMFHVMLFLALAAVQLCPAQSGSVLGEWRDPGGSVLSINQCGDSLCIWIVAIRKDAPETTDIHNPDSKLRSRPLCGLKIGEGFHPYGTQGADNGTLYDPKSGRTYHGEMKLVGEELHLRGYVGFSIFGRTETWQRPSGNVVACAPQSNR